MDVTIADLVHEMHEESAGTVQTGHSNGTHRNLMLSPTDWKALAARRDRIDFRTVETGCRRRFGHVCCTTLIFFLATQPPPASD
jgi:hypothetical protein